MRDAVLATLRAILIEDFRVPAAALAETATLRSDLYLDSAGILDFLYVVQKDFGFVVDHEAFERVLTLGDLADFIEAKRHPS